MNTFTSLLCCLGTWGRRQHVPDARSGVGQAEKSCLHATRRSVAAPFTRVEHLVETPGPRRRRWPRLRRMNRVFAPSTPSRGVTAAGSVEPRPATCATATAVVQVRRMEEEVVGDRASGHGFSEEHATAATIQAYFRGHLARQAFRALRSLVRLQALARGSYVRNQANVAIRFMKVLVRLQVRVHARQLLSARPS